MTLSLEQFTRPAGIHSHQIGDHRITYLPDGVALLEPRLWLPDSDDQVWIQNKHLINPDGYLVASVGALLIEYGNRAMLIDAGFGPLAVPTPFGSLRGGQLIESLAAAGKSLADIELVAITHLHLDHVGWLWQSDTGSASGSPFADLPILVGETEWQRQDLAIADGAAPEILDVFAAQVRTIADGQQIFPGVHVTATPGHSLGHLAYTITSPGHRLIAFGDAMHTPLQITRPDLTSAADDDAIAATKTSRRIISEMAARGTLGFGMHFADIQLGRVVTGAHSERIWHPE